MSSLLDGVNYISVIVFCIFHLCQCLFYNFILLPIFMFVDWYHYSSKINCKIDVNFHGSAAYLTRKWERRSCFVCCSTNTPPLELSSWTPQLCSDEIGSYLPMVNLSGLMCIGSCKVPRVLGLDQKVIPIIVFSFFKWLETMFGSKRASVLKRVFNQTYHKITKNIFSYQTHIKHNLDCKT